MQLKVRAVILLLAAAAPAATQTIVLGGNYIDNLQDCLATLGEAYTLSPAVLPDPTAFGLGQGDIIILGHDGGTAGFDYTPFLDAGGFVIGYGGSCSTDYHMNFIDLYFPATTYTCWHTCACTWETVGSHPSTAGVPASYSFTENQHTYHPFHFDPMQPAGTEIVGALGGAETEAICAVRQDYSGGGGIYWNALDLAWRPGDEPFITSSLAAAIEWARGNVSCRITSPAPAATVGGGVDVTFDVDDRDMDPLTAFYEYSTDAGVSYSPATPDVASPLANPSLGLTTPGTGLLFRWDSAGDMVGAAAPTATIFRITADDGAMHSSRCAVDLTVDNLNPPTCTLAGPVAPDSGDIDLVLDSTTMSAATVDATFAYSTDSGATWTMCSAAAASPISNPAISVPTGIATFVWDSVLDGVAPAAPVIGIIARAIIDDGGPITGSCVTAPFDVDNSALCNLTCGDCNLAGGPADILDALTAAQLAAGLGIPTMRQMGCCDVDSSMSITVIDALGIAQSSAGLPVTLTCP